jgi:hypothetical protein
VGSAFISWQKISNRHSPNEVPRFFILGWGYVLTGHLEKTGGKLPGIFGMMIKAIRRPVPFQETCLYDQIHKMRK